MRWGGSFTGCGVLKGDSRPLGRVMDMERKGGECGVLV